MGEVKKVSIKTFEDADMLKLEADDRGTTSRSLKFYYKNRERLGRLRKAEVRSTKITHPCPHFCYLVFEKGIVHFTGLNCGYHGTGPNGLAEILFKECFFSSIQDAVDFVAEHIDIKLDSDYAEAKQFKDIEEWDEKIQKNCPNAEFQVVTIPISNPTCKLTNGVCAYDVCPKRKAK